MRLYSVTFIACLFAILAHPLGVYCKGEKQKSPKDEKKQVGAKKEQSGEKQTSSKLKGDAISSQDNKQPQPASAQEQGANPDEEEPLEGDDYEDDEYYDEEDYQPMPFTIPEGVDFKSKHILGDLMVWAFGFLCLTYVGGLLIYIGSYDMLPQMIKAYIRKFLEPHISALKSKLQCNSGAGAGAGAGANTSVVAEFLKIQGVNELLKSVGIANNLTDIDRGSSRVVQTGITEEDVNKEVKAALYAAIDRKYAAYGKYFTYVGMGLSALGGLFLLKMNFA